MAALNVCRKTKQSVESVSVFLVCYLLLVIVTTLYVTCYLLVRPEAIACEAGLSFAGI